MGVVVRRYIDFLILLIPTPLVSVLFLQQHSSFLLKKIFFIILYILDRMSVVNNNSCV